MYSSHMKKLQQKVNINKVELIEKLLHCTGVSIFWIIRGLNPEFEVAVHEQHARFCKSECRAIQMFK